MGFAKWFARVGATGGLVRAQIRGYRKIRKRHPEASEQDIVNKLFNLRFSVLKPSRQESERLRQFHQSGSRVEGMYDLCVTILEIETGVSVFDQPAHSIACEVIEEELHRHGFATDGASGARVP